MAGGNRGRAELGFKPDTGEEKGKKERERETTWKADAEEAEGRKSPQNVTMATEFSTRWEDYMTSSSSPANLRK